MPRWLAQRAARRVSIGWMSWTPAFMHNTNERCGLNGASRPDNITLTRQDGLMLVGADMRLARVSFAGRSHAAGFQPA